RRAADPALRRRRRGVTRGRAPARGRALHPGRRPGPGRRRLTDAVVVLSGRASRTTTGAVRHRTTPVSSSSGLLGGLLRRLLRGGGLLGRRLLRGGLLGRRLLRSAGLLRRRLLGSRRRLRRRLLRG